MKILPRRPLIWPVLMLSFLVLFGACRREADEQVAVSTETSTMVPTPIPTSTASPSLVPELAEPAEPILTPSEASTSPGTPTSLERATETSPVRFQQFLPSVSESEPTPLPTATPDPSPTSTPTPVPTIDFAAKRSELQAAGQELGFAKFGFHVTFLDRPVALERWFRRLDEAGVPAVLKTVDNAGPLFDVQQIVQQSSVPHVLIFRSTVAGDVPDYNLPPVEAARIHWQRHRDVFPPELDKNVIWLETINEVDKQRSEWMAEFALATAQMAMAEGFRWAAFGWAAGEPEPEHWQSPAMVRFLRLAAANPDRLAIALHEGSGTIEDVAFEYPFRTGRFLKLFEICDALGIARPTVLITEWAWEFNNAPHTSQAIRDIEWASALYAPFPQVKGVAIWNLGTGWGGIIEKTAPLVDPLMIYTLTHYFSIPALPAQASTNPNLYAP